MADGVNACESQKLWKSDADDQLQMCLDINMTADKLCYFSKLTQTINSEFITLIPNSCLFFLVAKTPKK